MMAPGKRTYNITALQRGLRLLQLFAGAERGLTATQVAKRCGLPMSTVHRFLVNLESAGFLVAATNGAYHLGMACFSVGQAALAQLDIRRLSLPYLQDLNQQTRETIHLTVRHGLTAVYVEKLDSPEPVRIHSRIGASVPLYCTAVGKVMLAFMPAAEQAAILPQLEMKRRTPNSIGSMQELQTELLKVRRNGFACDFEENEIHIRCVAAPIWDHLGAVNASLSLTAPVLRMPNARMRQLAPLIQDAGKKISRELGYRSVESKRYQPEPVFPEARAT
ncbi:MAG TPA: IclR family transcriptional regulator [Terriglobales bacterium]|nr:IclR family transcriptional regulator [Terriglobales bacterium]